MLVLCLFLSYSCREKKMEFVHHYSIIFKRRNSSFFKVHETNIKNMKYEYAHDAAFLRLWKTVNKCCKKKYHCQKCVDIIEIWVILNRSAILQMQNVPLLHDFISNCVYAYILHTCLSLPIKWVLSDQLNLWMFITCILNVIIYLLFWLFYIHVYCSKE